MSTPEIGHGQKSWALPGGEPGSVTDVTPLPRTDSAGLLCWRKQAEQWRDPAFYN